MQKNTCGEQEGEKPAGGNEHGSLQSNMEGLGVWTKAMGKACRISGLERQMRPISPVKAKSQEKNLYGSSTGEELNKQKFRYCG